MSAEVSSLQAVCGACLSRGRRVSPLGAARAARVLRAAAEGADLGPMSRLAVCWECRTFVEKTIVFCDRVRRAQTILTSDNLSVLTDEDSDASMSTLSKTTKSGYDYVFHKETEKMDDAVCKQSHEMVHGDGAECSLDTKIITNETVSIVTEITKGDTKNDSSVEDNFVECYKYGLSDKFDSKDSELARDMNETRIEEDDESVISNDSNSYGELPISPNSFNDLDRVLSLNNGDIKKNIKDDKEPVLETGIAIVMKDLTKKTTRNIKSTDEPIVTVKSINGNKVKELRLSDLKIKPIKDDSKKALYTDASRDTLAGLAKSPVKIKLTPATDYVSQRAGRVSTTFMSEAEMLESREEDRSAENYVKSLFKCQTCIVGFNNGAFLEEHNRIKHNPELGAHACDICALRLPSALSVTNHRRTHYHLYVCSACGFTRRHLADVNRHYEDAHEADRSHECSQCHLVFRKLHQLTYHREKAHAKPRPCPHCGKAFTSRHSYSRHLELHTGAQLYECAICQKCCRGKALLSAHMRTHEPAAGGEDAYCAECDAQFKSKYIYRQHLRSSLKHVGRDDIKHACDKCDKRFTSPGELRIHCDVVHLNKELFKCEACDKNYVNSRGLKLHMLKVHAGVRPPRDKSCDICGKAFSSNTILSTHRRTHTGERPYACAECGATFRQSGALHKHGELVHGRKSNKKQQ